jgi:Acetolactate synthase
MSKTIRLTVGQALVQFVANQYVERDGQENKFIEGMWGIFGHGNVSGAWPGNSRVCGSVRVALLSTAA